MEFNFAESDHDNSEKTFLGNKGNFNGEDIVEMVAMHKATADFICKRLYLYFVSEEINHEEVIKLSDIYMKNQGEIKKVLEYIRASND